MNELMVWIWEFTAPLIIGVTVSGFGLSISVMIISLMLNTFRRV
jgi:hypothetical protein